jgi:hypothetical protein
MNVADNLQTELIVLISLKSNQINNKILLNISLEFLSIGSL